MRKIIFYSIPMKANPTPSVYVCEDCSLPVTNTPVVYPINAFLEKTLKKSDEAKILLLAKKDAGGHYKKNVELCIEEIGRTAEKCASKIEYSVIETDFAETPSTHYTLLMDIVNALEENAHVLADITYGPKDLPIVLFTALSFGEKFLGSEIDNIIYGQAEFEDGKAVNTRICDMVPLYYLNSVSNTIECASAAKAKQMLRALLTL